MVVQLCEYTKNHQTVCFKWVNCMLCKASLYIQDQDLLGLNKDPASHAACPPPPTPPKKVSLGKNKIQDTVRKTLSKNEVKD